jgi:hypothetical protein
MNTSVAHLPDLGATKEKLLGYLAAGVAPLVAANAAGVEPGYVTQLLQQEDFRQALALKGSELLEGALSHDRKLDKLEDKALNMVEQKLPFVRTATEAAKIFQTLNASKRRAMATDTNTSNLGAQTVTIVLPQAAAAFIKVNTTNQVIEVEGRTMAPLPSRSLPALQALLSVE